MRDQILRWLPYLSDHDLAEIEAAIEEELGGRDVCEHGIRDGEYCRRCREEYRRALAAYDGEGG